MPADKLRGVDALILGRIIDSRIIEETKHTGHGESIYQDGYRPEPNPDHVAAAREVDAALERFKRAQARLGDAEAHLARYDHVHPGDGEAMAKKRRARADVAEAKQRLANAATKLGIAQVRLAATPRDVMVPNMVRHEYPVHTVTRTARIGCMVKMLDTATDKLILAETLDGRHAHSDEMVAADPARNVPRDPLELPDDLTLIEEAAAEAIMKLKHALSMAARKHGNRFLVQMRHAETGGGGGQLCEISLRASCASRPDRQDDALPAEVSRQRRRTCRRARAPADARQVAARSGGVSGTDGRAQRRGHHPPVSQEAVQGRQVPLYAGVNRRAERPFNRRRSYVDGSLWRRRRG
jgi:hypothetical protein